MCVIFALVNAMLFIRRSAVGVGFQRGLIRAAAVAMVL